MSFSTIPLVIDSGAAASFQLSTSSRSSTDSRIAASSALCRLVLLGLMKNARSAPSARPGLAATKVVAAGRDHAGAGPHSASVRLRWGLIDEGISFS